MCAKSYFLSQTTVYRKLSQCHFTDSVTEIAQELAGFTFFERTAAGYRRSNKYYGDFIVVTLKNDEIHTLKRNDDGRVPKFSFCKIASDK